MRKLLPIVILLLCSLGSARVMLQNAQLQNAQLGLTNAPAGGGGGSFPSGAVIDWRLNNGLTDSSGNGNSATATGTTTYTTDELGAANKAFSFNGSTYIEAGGATAGNFTSSDFTISIWIKVTDSDFQGNHSVIWSKGIFGSSGYYAQFLEGSLSTKGKLTVTLNTAGGNIKDVVSVNDTFELNTWYNIVFVRTGTGGKIYVNGSDVTASSDTLADPVTDSHNFRTGEYSGGSNPLVGNVAQISVWGSALNSTQIGDIYSGGSL